MILGSSPISRPSDPTESGPGRPPPGEASRAAKGAQAVSNPWRAARQCQFPHVSSTTGSQAVSAHDTLCAIRVSNGSVPRVAHRPSVPHAGAVRQCELPGLPGLISHGWPGQLRLTFESLRPVHPDIRVPIVPPFHLDVAPLALAGSRPATDRSVQWTPPHLMMPVPAPAGQRMKPKIRP
jgi:hypothetical protein